MSATVTVTGVIGPAVAMTAAAFTSVSSFQVDCSGKETLTLTFADGRAPMIVSIAAATTMTVTISGSTYTVTIS